MLKAIFILGLLLLAPISSAATWGDYAEVTSYVDSVESGVAKQINSVKVGSGSTLNVSVTFKIKQDVKNLGFRLSASGFAESQPQPFEVLQGPSQFGKSEGRQDVKAGQTVELTWILKATSAWAGGSVPINVAFNLVDANTPRNNDASFTIANIYIEPSGGAAPAAATPRQPGFELIAAFSAFLTVAFLMRRR